MLSALAQNFGSNIAYNQYLAYMTGYTDDFGTGGYQSYLTARGWGNPPGAAGWVPHERQWGANPELNMHLADETGYLGDFGNGDFEYWLMTHDVAMPEDVGYWSSIPALPTSQPIPETAVYFGAAPFLPGPPPGGFAAGGMYFDADTNIVGQVATATNHPTLYVWSENYDPPILSEPPPGGFELDGVFYDYQGYTVGISLAPQPIDTTNTTPPLNTVVTVPPNALIVTNGIDPLTGSSTPPLAPMVPQLPAFPVAQPAQTNYLPMALGALALYFLVK